MHFDFQNVVNGLGIGAVYAVVALALVLIYRSTDVVNFAQGEMAMFCTFIGWSLMVGGVRILGLQLGTLPFWPAFCLTVIAAGIIGALVERIVVRPVENASLLSVVIVTLGLYSVFNALASAIWQSQPKSFPAPFPGPPFQVGPLFISRQYLGTFGVSLVIMALVFVFFQYTKLGLAMRAAAHNPTAARLVGIPVGTMLTLGWALASMIGAAAGMLIANIILLEPNMMAGVLIYAFAGAVLGGLSNPVGAILGGLIVGVVENIAGTTDFIGSELKTAVAFLIIVLVLTVKPSGLLGRTVAKKV